MEKKERTLEQKFVLVMSGLVLVFDDPLYFVGVFRPNVFMYVFGLFVGLCVRLFLLVSL